MAEHASPPDPDDELVSFSPEDDTTTGSGCGAAWRVLVVDDDEDVHSATAYAVANLLIQGHPLELLHARSAAEARALLTRERDVAVILLDVVMEEGDAGLKLVRVIRKELGLTDTRIILRTGQPGYAPEMEAVRDYDINDYKTKSELTQVKLFTALTAAIRSYEQIRTINSSRRGLDQIVRASSQLMALRGLQSFASGVITQITGLLGLPPESLVCVEAGDAGEPVVVAAAGRYQTLVDGRLSSIPHARVRGLLAQALVEHQSIYTDAASVVFVSSASGRNMVAYLDTPEPVSALDRKLLEVFCSNIAAGLDNVALFDQLNDYAYCDGLTALPNRRGFLKQVEERLAELNPVVRRRQVLALVDVDHFGETNHAFGHRYGDHLIQAVAARLRTAADPGVVVGRIAGDVFGVFGDAKHVDHKRLLGIFQLPFRVEGDDLPLSASVGLVRLGEVDASASDALKDASIALKGVKARQRGRYEYFTRAMDEEIRERVQLLQALRTGFAAGELSVVYQPQVDLVTGRPVGAEALLRWRTGDGEQISPVRFIPLAEQSGLIVSLGEWVLRSACEQLADWSRHGIQDIKIGVNVSVSQLRDHSFLEVLRRTVHGAGVDPHRIDLEITESIAMDGADVMLSMLAEIKRMGFSISVDDFGTGYSSLSQLQRLAVNRLKIDKTFVDEITATHHGGRIAETIVQLGRHLGLVVVAEGVETERQAEVLRVLGCHEAQGYLYARPMPPQELLRWLLSSGAADAPEH